MPNQYCLALLELNGIGFSTEECEAQKHVMQAKLKELESQAYQLAGHSFSLTSPGDVAEVCKVVLGYTPCVKSDDHLSFIVILIDTYTVIKRNLDRPPQNCVSHC